MKLTKQPYCLTLLRDIRIKQIGLRDLQRLVHIGYIIVIPQQLTK